MLFCVYVAALRRVDHSSEVSYWLCTKYYVTEEEARAKQRAVVPLMNEWMNEYSVQWMDANEFEKMWRKVVVPNFTILSKSSSGGTKEAMKTLRVVNGPVDIWIEHIRSTSQKGYVFSRVAR
jgi:hypothetical protein